MRWLVAAAILLGGGAPAADDAVTRVADALAAAGSRSIGQAQAAAVLHGEGATPATADTPDLAARWARRPATPYRDRANGPGYRTVALPGGAALSVEQVFLAGQWARIAVVARDAPAFALSVSDPEGQARCRQAGRRADCAWVPSFTARARVELHNTGTRPARFFVVMQ